MVVATGTVDGHPQHDLAGRGNDAVEPLVVGQQSVGRLIVPDSQAVESGRDQRLGRGWVDLIARESARG